MDCTVRSNVEPELFDAGQTVRAYKDLKVELPQYEDGGSVGSTTGALTGYGLCCACPTVEWHMRSDAGAVR